MSKLFKIYVQFWCQIAHASSAKFHHVSIPNKNRIMPELNGLGVYLRRDRGQENLDQAHKMPSLPRKMGTSLRALCRSDRIRSGGGKLYGDDGAMTDFTGQVNSAHMLFNNFMC